MRITASFSTNAKARFRNRCGCIALSAFALSMSVASTPADAAAAPKDPDDNLGRVAAPLSSNSPVPKVIVISLDGAKPEFIDNYIATHVLPANSGLGLLRSKGTRATQNITATPSLTAVAHLAIATGSTAVHNDVPSNSFHPVASPIGTTASGFGAAIGGYAISPLGPTLNPTAIPLWVPLRNAGKKVVTATWPGGDGADIRISNVVVQPAVPARTVDYTVPFGAFGGLGAQGFILTSANFGYDEAIEGQLAAAGHTSFSPVQVSTAPIETLFCAPTNAATCGTTNAAGRTLTYNIKVAALDSTNDHATNYDTLVFFDAGQAIAAGPFAPPHTGPAYAKNRKSAPFFFEGSGSVVGAAYYVVNLRPNLSQVRFVRYGANFIPQNAAVLGDVADVNDSVGFWAPQPDFRIPERLSPGFSAFTDRELEQVYEDQVKTWTKYQTQLALHAIDQNPDADLLMLYFEQPDGSEHQFLLTDPRQASNPANASSIGAGQDAAKVARYDGYIKNAYRRANGAVEAVINKVGKRFGVPRSNIIVVSDHGFAPFHTAVAANNLLSAALVSGGFSPSLAGSSVVIRTSGPAANVYINLAGRESGGTVDAATYQALVAAIANYLQNVTDPNATYNYSLTGGKLFSHVFVRPAACGQPGFCTNDEIGQDSGDIVGLMDVGYNFDGTQNPGIARLGDGPFNAASTIFSVPNFYGAHGHHASIPAMSASFYAAGPNIKSGIVVPQMHNIDVAPTIMTMLGVAPANTVDGTALTEILK